MEAKDTFFITKSTLNCRGRLVDLSRPRVMGIININADSFYSGSRADNEQEVLKRAEKMTLDGASFIDLGVSSTRPGAPLSKAEDEIPILLPILEILRKEIPEIFISIDTYHPEVVKTAYGAGADLINDISGGQFFSGMFEAVAETGLPYILMHTPGIPSKMQSLNQYEDVAKDILLFFSEKIAALEGLGVKDIMVDPGFGFGKSVEQNLELLKKLEVFKITGRLIVAGLSRKSMVKLITGQAPEEALNGSTVFHTLALIRGADILRVHDVAEAIEAVKITREYQQAGSIHNI